MSREILINTPENVTLEYELAGVGTRFTANLIDSALLLLIFLAVYVGALLLGLLLTYVAASAHVAWLSRLLGTAADWVVGAALIGGFIVFWGYFIIFEYRWNGQTPGKRSAGLRVIREGGYPVDLYSVVLRNLLRVVDFLPVAYFAGLVSILCSRGYQRLGDIVGGTLVVKQRAPQNLSNLLQATRLRPEHLDRSALALMQREADRLTLDEYRAVRHFTERRRGLPSPEVQQQAARALAEPLMQRLHIVPPAGVTSVNYADVLEYLAVAYENARRPLDMSTTHPAAPVPQPVALAEELTAGPAPR